MTTISRRKRDVEKAADIVRDAGGKVVGRTRLQKIAYLLELAGLGDGFVFEYRHYGPYSEDLANAVRDADLLGLLKEEEFQAAWGGSYSIFTSGNGGNMEASESRRILAHEASKADPIELELAATAAFLWSQGAKEPWVETARRKPEKAEGGRLAKSKALYRKLSRIETAIALPEIA